MNVPPVPPEIRQQAAPQPGLMTQVANNPGLMQGQQPGSGQAGGGMQQLAQAVSQLADQTGMVMRLAQVAHPPLMAFVEKFIEIGKAMQAELTRAAQSAQTQGEQPPPQPPPTNPAEPPAAGTVV